MSDLILPVRIQRRRAEGWRMPFLAVYVGRPTDFGNPFRDRIGPNGEFGPAYDVDLFRRWVKNGLPEEVADRTKLGVPSDDQIAALDKRRRVLLVRLPDLRGKVLACWCPLDRPCHADVLLEIANA